MRSLRAAAVYACAVVVTAQVAACTQREVGASPIARGADELFGERLVPRFELELDDAARASLARAPKEWVRGTFRYAGVTYPDVAVRLKGNRSRQGLGAKPAFKIRFDKFVDKRRFLGLSQLVLNNLVEDPTMVREALAYRLHRDLGVPAPRTGWAQLRLNGEDLGLYLDLEAVDDPLLERVFDDHKGTVYEGEFGCDLYPDDAPRFEQDGGKDQDHADLIELAARVSGGADDPSRLFAADGPLDVERVVAYLAVSAVIGDFDGYRHSHNYRLHHDRRTDRWSMLPWGLDRTFKKHLDVMDSGGLLARRCFADDRCRARYAVAVERAAARLQHLAATGVLDRWFILVDAATVRDPRKPYDAKAMSEARSELRRFVGSRPGAVRASLGALASPPRPPAPACEPATVGGAGFQLCRTPLTWAEAEAHCATLGAHLARSDDAEQSRGLAGLIRERGGSAGNDRWWIGLSDRGREDQAAWSDGAPVGFTGWAEGQPDDAACGEDCAALRPKNGTWSDGHCALRRPFICRR